MRHDMMMFIKNGRTFVHGYKRNVLINLQVILIKEFDYVSSITIVKVMFLL